VLTAHDSFTPGNDIRALRPSAGDKAACLATVLSDNSRPVRSRAADCDVGPAHSMMVDCPVCPNLTEITGILGLPGRLQTALPDLILIVLRLATPRPHHNSQELTGLVLADGPAVTPWSTSRKPHPLAVLAWDAQCDDPWTQVFFGFACPGPLVKSRARKFFPHSSSASAALISPWNRKE
jgi:hypothetical protein